MRSLALLAVTFITLIASTARAETAEKPRDEDVAFRLSLGGELASIGLIAVPIVREIIADGCNIKDADGVVVDTRDGGACSPALDTPMAALAITGAIGLVVAPSFGHYYGTGHVWTRGAKLRLAGLLIATAGSLAITGWDDGALRADRFPGAIVPAAGVAVFAIGSIDDIASVKARVREHNSVLSNAVIAPAPMPGGAGLVVAGRF